MTPHKDEARELGSGAGFRGREQEDSSDCAHTDMQRKRIATLTARAALLGLVLQPAAAGTWHLVNGRSAAVLPSLQAAAGLIYGCEQVSREIQALMAMAAPVQGGLQ